MGAAEPLALGLLLRRANRRRCGGSSRDRGGLISRLRALSLEHEIWQHGLGAGMSRRPLWSPGLCVRSPDARILYVFAHRCGA